MRETGDFRTNVVILLSWCVNWPFLRTNYPTCKHGERALQALAEKIHEERLSYSSILRLFRQLQLAFPELSASVSNFLLSDNRIWQPVTAKLKLSGIFLYPSDSAAYQAVCSGSVIGIQETDDFPEKLLTVPGLCDF